MAINNFQFSKLWTDSSPETGFKTFETDETQVRADMQLLFDELAAFLNTYVVPRVNSDETGLTGLTAALENVQQQLIDITQGSVADESISTQKVADGAITVDKIADETITDEKVAERGFIEDITELMSTTNRTGNSPHTKEFTFYRVKAIKMVYFTGLITFEGVGISESTPATRHAYFDFTGYCPQTAQPRAFQAACMKGDAKAAVRDPGGTDFDYTVCVDVTGIPATATGDIEVIVSGWYSYY